MSKPAKSQWDFGELFSAEETRKVLSVSELTTQVRALLEKHIGRIWVSGEIAPICARKVPAMFISRSRTRGRAQWC